MKVIKRKVFLDDTQNEADIRRQFNRAVELARRNSFRYRDWAPSSFDGTRIAANGL